MNKHIELVKKWLADKDSVSLEELEANKKSAEAEANDAYASGDAAYTEYYTAYYTAYYTYVAYAANDAAAEAAEAAAHAAYWIERYEELINE